MRTTLAPLVLALALATPAAAHAQGGGSCAKPEARQDLRSPDTRDVAEGRTITAPERTDDLRSPDTRDVAEGRTITAPERTDDLRSPDTVDAALGHGGSTAVEIADPGFNWGDAAIGAGGLAGVLALASAGALTLRHRSTTTVR